MAFFVLNALITNKKLSFKALVGNFNSSFFSMCCFDESDKSLNPNKVSVKLVICC